MLMWQFLVGPGLLVRDPTPTPMSFLEQYTIWKKFKSPIYFLFDCTSPIYVCVLFHRLALTLRQSILGRTRKIRMSSSGIS